MFKKVLTTTICLTLGLVTATSYAGNGSNRNAVRSKVTAGGWEIVWGVTINEAEYAKFIAASYNGAPMAYFSNYLNRNIDKFTRNSPGVAKSGLIRAIKRAFKDRGRSFRVGKIGVKAGLATYRRWYTVKVPAGKEKYKIYGPRNPFTGKRTWTWGYRPKFKSKRVPLPNHHQPYVGFRLYASGSAVTRWVKAYNHTGLTLHYSLKLAQGPWKKFTLETGRYYRHRTTSRNAKFQILFDSSTIPGLQNKQYSLGSGRSYVFKKRGSSLNLYNR